MQAPVDVEREITKVRLPSGKRTSLDASIYSFSGISKGGSIGGAVVEEMRSHGAVANKVYNGYFRAGGNWCFILFVFFMFVITQVIASASDYFLSTWYVSFYIRGTGK